MEAFLQFTSMTGSMGLPSMVIGTILFLYSSLRKQEAVVRTEQLETIERLKNDRDEVILRNDNLEEENINLKKELSMSHLEITQLKIELLKAQGGGQTDGS